MRFTTLTKSITVVVGAMVLASVVVRATDVFDGPADSLFSTVLEHDASSVHCENGMQYVSDRERPFCIDTYERSTRSECRHSVPLHVQETQQNITADTCRSVSAPDSIPWTNVSLLQAMELCAKEGMRLPSAREWYRAALGTPGDIEQCVLEGNGKALPTASMPTCHSSHGVFDMVGNVWEWVDEEITNGNWMERELPEEGYIVAADLSGVPTETAATSSKLFGGDRLWRAHRGVMGMMRGGYYGSGSDGGVYALYGASAPSFGGSAVGFRCVADAR